MASDKSLEGDAYSVITELSVSSWSNFEILITKVYYGLINSSVSTTHEFPGGSEYEDVRKKKNMKIFLS